MKGNILELSSITKRFGKNKVLDDVSFSLKKGEILGLVGPNGAGKSTLMKIIVGLIKNHQGSVSINIPNKNYINENVRIIGSTIEEPGFYSDLSGRDNLRYFSKLYNIYSEENINSIIKTVGIEDFVDKKAKTYSMGMKQRLALAQATIGQPKLLILDEPTNGLDPQIMIDIRNFLKVLASTGTAILISSHILTEVESLCQRILMLMNGQIMDEIVISQSDFKSGGIYIFETSQMENLIEYFNNNGIVSTMIEPNKLSVETKGKNIEDLLSSIMKKNILISGVYKKKDSLEKIFIDLMEESKIE